MATCEQCGKRFNVNKAREIFEDECGRLWSYDNFTECLCGDCAVEAIQEEVEGVYFETCVKCGKRFDYGEECAEFYNYDNGDIGLAACWDEGPLCASCAIDNIEEENAMYGNHDDDDDEEDYDDDDERLDVYTAAENWLASGEDEDCMFGYTEEELRNALR